MEIIPHGPTYPGHLKETSITYKNYHYYHYDLSMKVKRVVLYQKTPLIRKHKRSQARRENRRDKGQLLNPILHYFLFTRLSLFCVSMTKFVCLSVCLLQFYYPISIIKILRFVCLFVRLSVCCSLIIPDK